MDKHAEERIKKIKIMTTKELLNDNLMKYDKRIYNDALGRALISENVRYTLEPQFVEFKVHYVTSVSIINSMYSLVKKYVWQDLLVFQVIGMQFIDRKYKV